MDRGGFASMMRTLHYVEPPDEQHHEGHEGHEQLFEFFGRKDPPPMSLVWHHIVFDPDQQMGAAEYTYRGTRTYHGLTLVRLEDDRIADWREYQYPSELDWEAFSAGNRC